MIRKWTPKMKKIAAANAAKARAALAAKRARGEVIGKPKGTEIPLELIPAPMQSVAKKGPKPRGKSLEAQEMEALGEIITNVWLALCRKNRGL